MRHQDNDYYDQLEDEYYSTYCGLHHEPLDHDGLCRMCWLDEIEWKAEQLKENQLYRTLDKI